MSGQKKVTNPVKTKSSQNKTTAVNKEILVHSPFFVILPDTRTLFAKRAERFAHLATKEPTQELLLFFAHFCNAQQQSSKKFKDLAIPLSRFGASSAPPLDRSKLLILGLYESIVEDFLNHLSTPTLSVQPLSETRYAALKSTKQQKNDWRLWSHNLLNHKLPQHQLTEHVFILGALQIMYSLAASQLDAQNLTAQQNNLCPACQGTHSASLIIDWKAHETVKVCSCLYCGTLWYHPHTQCTFCEATEPISTHVSPTTPDGILFETCDNCGSYSKLLDCHKNPTLDVFTDDISTPTPEFLASSFKYKSFNPFLEQKK
ncbi:FdhE protein [Bartonella japonica]|uniref:FdhE protein n=1 Tax=Bartonella japonica TaxID=357761 RepID=A0ABV2FPU4_9HYPH